VHSEACQPDDAKREQQFNPTDCSASHSEALFRVLDRLRLSDPIRFTEAGIMPIKFTKETSSRLFRYVKTVDIKFNRECNLERVHANDSFVLSFNHSFVVFDFVFIVH
jgi:hypothetical protein